METNALSTEKAENRIAVKRDDSVFDKMAKTGNWLPRFQLFGSKADAVTMGKIGPGRYGVVDGDRIIDLGPDIVISVHSWRPKALRIDKAAGTVLNYYDPDDAMFQEVQSQAGVQDSGCMFGPEFLVWIPKLNRFASFYMNSKTMRRAAPDVKDAMTAAQPIQLGVKLIDNKRFKWHGPTVKPWSAPLESVPEPDALATQVQDFEHPQATTVEIADQATVDRER